MQRAQKWLDALVMTAVLVELTTTPEQRERWIRNNDWNYHASTFTD